MISCPGCGGSVDELAATCPDCGKTLIVEVAADPPPPGEAPPPGGSSVPFENRSLPFSTRMFETIKLAVVDPVSLFSRVPDDSDIGPAVLYGVIIGTIAYSFATLWQLVWGGFLSALDNFAPEGMMFQTGFSLFMLLFSPLFSVIVLFVSTAIFHVCLLVLGDGKRGFAVTLRVVAYGGTPGLVAIVPLCGGFIGGVWSVVLFVIGATSGHGTEWWRALLAYLILPLILCCCFFFMFSAMLGLIGGMAQ